MDGISVGPCGLSVDLGIPLEFDNPVLIRAVERGFDSVTCSLDAAVFIEAFQSLASRFRQELA